MCLGQRMTHTGWVNKWSYSSTQTHPSHRSEVIFYCSPLSRFCLTTSRICSSMMRRRYSSMWLIISVVYILPIWALTVHSNTDNRNYTYRATMWWYMHIYVFISRNAGVAFLTDLQARPISLGSTLPLRKGRPVTEHGDFSTEHW